MLSHPFGSLAAAVAIASLCAGCSPYPLPQDVSGHRTLDIVREVRCEVRAAIRDNAIGYLEAHGTEIAYEGRLTGAQVASELRSKPSLFHEYKLSHFARTFQDVFNYYRNTQVIYEFSLNSSEMNSDGITLGLLRTTGARVDNVGLTSRADLTRDVRRSFKVFDTFIDLVTIVAEDYCSRPRTVDVIYPAGGRKKLAELVQTFLELNLDPTLQGTPEKPNVLSMGDTAIFTTKLSGNVDPTLTFDTPAFGLGVASLAITSDNYRQDLDQVVVNISATSNRGKGTAEIGRPISDARRAAQRAVGESALREQRQRDLNDTIIQFGTTLNRVLP